MSQGYSSRKCAIPNCEEEVVHPFLIIRLGYCFKHLKKEKRKMKKEMKKDG